MRASEEIQIAHGDNFETLKRCGGYYACPKEASGKRLGPLVGYAACYEGKLQWVGDVYYNFAMAEQYPQVRNHLAIQLATKFREHKIEPDVIIGAPMGGILLSGDIGRRLDCRTIFLEKEVKEVKSDTSREKSALAFIRHSIRKGDRAVIGEDLVNNLSTSEKADKLISDAGGILVAISCGCNRSSQTFCEVRGRRIPILSAMDLPTQQFKQDDPAVADDVLAGNVVWKPKDEWSRLTAAVKA
jgi:orotate phosphoribosyltransferase